MRLFRSGLSLSCPPPRFFGRALSETANADDHPTIRITLGLGASRCLVRAHSATRLSDIARCFRVLARLDATLNLRAEGSIPSRLTTPFTALTAFSIPPLGCSAAPGLRSVASHHHRADRRRTADGGRPRHAHALHPDRDALWGADSVPWRPACASPEEPSMYCDPLRAARSDSAAGVCGPFRDDVTQFYMVQGGHSSAYSVMFVGTC